MSRLSSPENPLEVFYFVEGSGGERVPAEVTAATLNSLDLQRAAIVLGHRVLKPLAQGESECQSAHRQTAFQLQTWYMEKGRVSSVSHLNLTCVSLFPFQLWRSSLSPQQRHKATTSG